VQIDERTIGDVAVLDLHGKITAGDRFIRDTIQALIARGLRKVLLNFADVSYMDSVGLSAIVQAHLTLGQTGGQLVLLHVPKRIGDLFAVTHLTAVFERFDDEAAAIRSFDPCERTVAQSRD